MVQPVPDTINFPQEEENVMKLWKELDAFKSCLRQSKNRPRYNFYDGPPFATGMPHYGHILAGTVKDVVTRWAHQSGFHVERRFGWDCHGLPVEYEIDKMLDIKGPDDVAKMGIENYNKECRKIVSRYSAEWEETVGRMGRWIDFKNDYKTMYPWFMESIWWIFKQLFDKGFVYKGHKVMPFSTACSTPLSNFEGGLNYKDADDPAVIVTFPLVDEPDVSLVAWTTTPWTLPSNMSCCVNPEYEYVKLRDLNSGKKYIMMEARISEMYKSEDAYEILARFPGKKLEGRKYTPLFPYFTYMEAKGAFRVLTGSYVTQDSGTGIVHQAPYFGEDDYKSALKAGIITKNMKPICPLDMTGKFTEEVSDFKGQYIKDADKNIIKHLKAKDRLVSEGRCRHSYPFCWRSETPLIYRAIPSWFVQVEQMVDKLQESNAKTRWVPDYVREGRFANWLKDARDWAISRNRYWGTPIPLWVSDDGQEVVCVGSIAELEELTGVQGINDLHREFVDKLTIPSRMGKGVLRRVSEVFDCWFESGSMPYAQCHYPFENKKEFEDAFPADFIAEGIDQTRGWFYTLLVLSTALYGKPPFKNLICFGLVLAADGQKMSKRKKNYPDPMSLVNAYGADAVRLYLINSPVVRADNLKFKEEGVRDVIKDVFLPWFNAYRFLIQNVHRLKKEEGVDFVYDEKKATNPLNYMDHWIMSFTQSLIKFVKCEMAAYRLYTVVPRLVKFVDQLTNWFVRMNRKRLKGDTGRADCEQALATLFDVLFTMTKVMAPFIPFLTEHMYQNLKRLLPGDGQEKNTESVHYLMLPTPNDRMIDPKIETAVSRMQAVVELGRVVRDRNTMPMKYPLKEVVVIHKDSACLEDVKALENYVKEELNVREVTTSSDKEKYGVKLKADADFKVLGARLKKDMKAVTAALREKTDNQLTEFQKKGSMEVVGHTLVTGEVMLKYAFDGAAKSNASYDAHSDGDILVLLDVTPDQSMLDEGLAREVMNRVQRLRKKAKLQPTEDITIYYKTSKSLGDLMQNYCEFIYSAVKQPLVAYPVPSNLSVIIEEKGKVKTDELEMTIVKGRHADPPVSSASSVSSDAKSSVVSSTSNGPAPFCRFVNVELCGVKPSGGASGSRATILLENPIGDFIISHERLLHEVQIIFGLSSKPKIFRGKDRKNEVTKETDVMSLNGSLLYVY